MTTADNKSQAKQSGDNPAPLIWNMRETIHGLRGGGRSTKRGRTCQLFVQFLIILKTHSTILARWPAACTMNLSTMKHQGASVAAIRRAIFSSLFLCATFIDIRSALSAAN